MWEGPCESQSKTRSWLVVKLTKEKNVQRVEHAGTRIKAIIDRAVVATDTCLSTVGPLRSRLSRQGVILRPLGLVEALNPCILSTQQGGHVDSRKFAIVATLSTTDCLQQL